MGTPKFSLKFALASLRPYLDYLSFQPIESVIGKIMFSHMIDGRNCIFELFRKHVMMSAVLSANSMVHAIPISKDVVKRPNGVVRQVLIRNLILERNDTAVLHGEWFYQITRYLPTSNAYNFQSVSSSITWICMDDESQENNIPFPPNFDVQIQEHILEWLGDSMKPSSRRLTMLRALETAMKSPQSECVIGP